jgi:hypothetical protein
MVLVADLELTRRQLVCTAAAGRPAAKPDEQTDSLPLLPYLGSVHTAVTPVLGVLTVGCV